MNIFCYIQQSNDQDVILLPSSPKTNKPHQVSSSEYLNYPSPKLSRTDKRNSKKEGNSRQNEIAGNFYLTLLIHILSMHFLHFNYFLSTTKMILC